VNELRNFFLLLQHMLKVPSSIEATLALNSMTRAGFTAQEGSSTVKNNDVSRKTYRLSLHREVSEIRYRGKGC